MLERVCAIVTVAAIASALLPIGTLVAATDPALARGIQQVKEGDFDAAIVTLDGVVRRAATRPGSAAEMAQAQLYLGVAYLSLEQAEKAKVAFRRALDADPGLRLDPRSFSPRVIRTFEEARGVKPAAAPPIAPTATPTATASPAPTPQATRSPAKGGGSKTPLIVLGAVAVAGAGVAVVAGGGGSDAGSGSGGGGASNSPFTTAGNYKGISGTWRGTTSAGNEGPASVSFTVVDDGRIAGFSLSANAVCAMTFGLSFRDGAVANNSFEVQSATSSGVTTFWIIRGTFSSATSASGTFSDTRAANVNSQNCNRTWTAARQ